MLVSYSLQLYEKKNCKRVKTKLYISFSGQCGSPSRVLRESSLLMLMLMVMVT